MISSTNLNILIYNTQSRLKAETARNYLGFLWWIIEPILNLAVYYVFIGLLLQRGDENYIYTLFIGLLTWKWIAKAITTSTGSIIAKNGLINQVYIPKYIFPVSEVLYSTWKYLIILIFLLLFFVAVGFGSSLYLIHLPPILLIFFLICLGGSLVSAAITPFVPDFKYLIPQLLQILFYGSGVIFDKGIVPKKYHYILELNPLFNCFEALKGVTIFKRSPNYNHLFPAFLIGLGLVYLGLWIIKRNDKVYPKIM